MKPLGLNQLRTLFLDFYKSKGHYKKESFSLIPQDDKSLLLINSGMAPMKPYFAGVKKPPALRMTTCQKCVRTADIENVGKTSRHGTFFEMLGSFSFGDYFKEESITWGWEFIKDVLKMPLDRVWVSVYLEDNEAYDIWKNKIRLPKERIVRLGKEDNFWEIGSGPCGPCSEVYYDRGEEYGCDNPDCKPGCQCDRYVEFWNHVFTQFNNDGNGVYTELTHKNIDTGMGLERLACIMQGTDSIFEVDTIAKTLGTVSNMTGCKYCNGKAASDTYIRIITDHLRTVTFMIGDGIAPSNEGRGYVLRRLLRRAVNCGRKLGVTEPFLANVAESVIEISKEAYPVLEEKSQFILKSITMEEKKFSTTLEQGMKMIVGYMAQLKAEGVTTLSGGKAFKLHDTFGFPVDLTEEILREKGFSVDKDGFLKEMKIQKSMSKADAKSNDFAWEKKRENPDIYSGLTTEFAGYENYNGLGNILKIVVNGKEIPEYSKSDEKDDVLIVTDTTVFYGMGGGQEGDTGRVVGKSFNANVISVNKIDKAILHHLNHVEGSVKTGESIEMFVNQPQRNATAANHTATHLLQGALKEVLGNHVAQAGSKLDNKSLRFDFTHFEALSQKEISLVENIVNEQISSFIPVLTEENTPLDARAKGAIGLFEDRYGEVVRVVSIGSTSIELCGGTHVSNTGMIGGFVIINESGIAGGVRRIEAVTGQSIVTGYNACRDKIGNLNALLKTDEDHLEEKVQSLRTENKALIKEIEKIKENTVKSVGEDLISSAVLVDDIWLLTASFEDISTNDLRNMADDLRNKKNNLVMIFVAKTKGKATFLVALNDSAIGTGLHAGKIVKEIANLAGGNGGGKADMAQAGCGDPAAAEQALSYAENIVKQFRS